ncbi:MAG: DUF2807 domain-containing protein [Flavobacteriaceae bacterium]|nr:DUF2807 domain-containing protein [Flavobacteriaceae bacterium]
MNKKNIFLIALILTTCFSFSQKKEKIKGNKNVIINEYAINTFNRIVVGEKFKIELLEGSKPSVFIEADENLHDVIDFRVSDSTLSFQTLKRITSKKKLNIKITYTSELNFIETMDNGEVTSSTSINLTELLLKNTGSSRAYLNIRSDLFKHINSQNAKVELNVNTKNATLELDENSKLEALINAENLQVDLFERASARIDGNVDTLKINADNTSNYKGKNLTAKICELKCSLNSDVHIQAIDELKIYATGNCEVYIYGNPAIKIDAFTDTSKLFKKEL